MTSSALGKENAAVGLFFLLFISPALGHNDTNINHYEIGFNEGYWVGCEHGSGIRVKTQEGEKCEPGTGSKLIPGQEKTGAGLHGPRSRFHYVQCMGKVGAVTPYHWSQSESNFYMTTPQQIQTGKPEALQFWIDKERFTKIFKGSSLKWPTWLQDYSSMHSPSLKAFAVARNGIIPGVAQFGPTAGDQSRAFFSWESTGELMPRGATEKWSFQFDEHQLDNMVGLGIDGGLYLSCDQ